MRETLETTRQNFRRIVSSLVHRIASGFCITDRKTEKRREMSFQCALSAMIRAAPDPCSGLEKKRRNVRHRVGCPRVNAEVPAESPESVNKRVRNAKCTTAISRRRSTDTGAGGDATACPTPIFIAESAPSIAAAVLGKRIYCPCTAQLALCPPLTAP